MALLEALNDRLVKAKSLTFGHETLDLPGALASVNPNMLEAAQNAIQELGKGLPELVIKDERFPGDRAQLVRSIPGVATGFYPHFVGSLLVRCAVKMGSADAAIEWLLKVLSTNAATGKFVHVLLGVKVDQEIALTDDVKLVPIDALPNSLQKTRLLNDSSHARSHFSTMLDWTVPQSALLTDITIEPFLCGEGQTPSSDFDAFTKKKELLQDITLALSVVGPCTPMLGLQWSTLDDPNLELAGLLSGATMRMGKALEILPWKPIEAPSLDPKEAPELVRALLDLQLKPKQKMRVAMSRLIQAQLRHEIGDRAVELSTAFETLLGDEGTNEMTHKVTVRLVRIIGGTDDLRKKNYQVMKATYDYRSKLLHTGFIDPGASKMIAGVKMSALDIVDHAAIMCVDLIKLLLRRGAIPEWAHFDITDHAPS